MSSKADENCRTSLIRMAAGLLFPGLWVIGVPLAVFSAGQTDSVLKNVPFRFRAVIGGVNQVYLAGTFNDWDGGRHEMQDRDGDGLFETNLLLPAGRYLYKFVVDGEWLTDPEAKEFEPDGRGGRNAVLIVDNRFDAAVFQAGDGRISLFEVPVRPDYTLVNPDEAGLEFRFRAFSGDLESMVLRILEGGTWEAVPMILDGSDETYDYYRCRISRDVREPLRFLFELQDGAIRLTAGPKGLTAESPGESGAYVYDPQELPLFLTPDWAKDGIFYQIFPDRFCNGDPSNDQDFSEPYYEGVSSPPPEGNGRLEYFHLVRDWSDCSGLTASPFRSDGRPDYFSFYGGDIAGVSGKLDYLHDLGVTILYFNPLNEARSNHKYDPVDYGRIDPHFADEETFREFTRKAHDLGIRIIVDMAFNHTGDWHYAFRDTREKGEASPYWHWYEWRRWPLPEGGCPTPCDFYDCWWGYPIHPNLNYDLSRPNDQENGITNMAEAVPNLDVVHHILDVARYWIGTLGIDGFRLDVPNEVPLWMWKEFRAVVDSLKPDAFLIGEIWGNAMPWLGPDCFHSTMNYKYFRDPVLQFFAARSVDAARFDRMLAPGRQQYPLQATQVMMNLIGSHDTERFITLAGGDERRLMLAALFQMTYVGIPQVYYGDEVGLEGGRDPDNRRTFPWYWESDENRSRIHHYYKRIMNIRRNHAALRTGSYRTLHARDGTLIFLRSKDEEILVAIHNEEKAGDITLDLGGPSTGEWQDLMTGDRIPVKQSRMTLHLDPLSGRILRKLH
ncbi:alpha amylase N-terminal ig-like domain-containing protein [bacterium]|nr:alpha amylase N-terminal ig-like domain-containing protein [bacterium]